MGNDILAPSGSRKFRHSGSSQGNPSLIAIHNILQIVGFLFISLVLIPAIVSPRVHRSPNWFLFMSLWLCWCTVYFLLVGQQMGEAPNQGLCIAQAVLINSLGVTTVFSILGITLEVCLAIATSLRKRAFARQRFINLITFWTPLVVLVLIFIVNLVVAVKTQTVLRTPCGAYCINLDHSILFASGSLILISLGTVVIVLFATCFLLFQYYKRSDKFSSEIQLLSIPCFIRIFIFSLLPIMFWIVMGIRMAGGVDLWDSDEMVAVVLLDFMPIAAALIFGTQSDILNVYMFWRSPVLTSNTNKNSQSPRSSESFSNLVRVENGEYISHSSVPRPTAP